jgi:hypothetical protein
MPETPEPLKPTEPGGEMEHQDPRHADDLENAAGGAGQEERSYDPSDVEATRARQQGGGVGQKDLDAQRDATGADSTEHFGQMKQDGGRDGGTDAEGGESRKSGVEQA